MKAGHAEYMNRDEEEKSAFNNLHCTKNRLITGIILDVWRTFFFFNNLRGRIFDWMMQ